MDDVIACSATWAAHLRFIEDMFRALQADNQLTIKPFQIYFGPKGVHDIGHVLSSDDIRNGEDRIKAIVVLKTSTTVLSINFALF